MDLSAINWGDAPTWATAGVAALAGGAALYAGIKARDLLRVEMRRDRRAEEVDRIRQASTVSAWAKLRPVDAHGAWFAPDVQFVARNTSDQPVFDVAVAFWVEDLKREAGTAFVLAPSDDITWKLERELLDTIGDGLTSGTAYSLPMSALEASTLVLNQIRVEITFRDSRNQRWLRDRDGQLVRLA